MFENVFKLAFHLHLLVSVEHSKIFIIEFEEGRRQRKLVPSARLHHRPLGCPSKLTISRKGIHREVFMINLKTSSGQSYFFRRLNTTGKAEPLRGNVEGSNRNLILPLLTVDVNLYVHTVRSILNTDANQRTAWSGALRVAQNQFFQIRWAFRMTNVHEVC